MGRTNHSNAVSPFDGISQFVSSSLSHVRLAPDADVLDIPSGFGRHAIWLAEQGCSVLAADLDVNRLEALMRHIAPRPKLRVNCLQLDAEKPWPLPPEAFDLVVVVHYVGALVLGEAHRVLRAGGFLIFETFQAHGRNWQGLPLFGSTKKKAENLFEIVDCTQRVVGPDRNREVVQLFAQKHPSPTQQVGDGRILK